MKPSREHRAGLQPRAGEDDSNLACLVRRRDATNCPPDRSPRPVATKGLTAHALPPDPHSNYVMGRITHYYTSDEAEAHTGRDGQQATAITNQSGQQATYSAQALGQQATQSAETTGAPPPSTPMSTGDSEEGARALPAFMINIQYPHAPEEVTATKHGTSIQEQETGDVQMDFTSHCQLTKADARASEHRPYPTGVMHSDHARLYEAACEWELSHPGTQGVYVPTNLKIKEWEIRATGHQDDIWIIEALKYGFPVQYKGPPRYEPLSLYNHASANNYTQAIRKYIDKELSMGAIYGPYDSPPFTPWMIISPLMTREKPDSDERRVIVDLSYPQGGVNQHILPHVFNNRPATHNLPTVEMAVEIIARTPPGDVHLAVIDLSRAYRQFPVPPTDWPLLGLYFDGKYFCDGRIPFGARLSSYAMQSVANFITRALEKRGITALMYLDDILIISAGEQLARTQYRITLELLETLGLQVAHKKLQPPNTAVTWLGVHIDLVRNTLSIPVHKVELIQKCLAAAARQKSITTRHLQSLLGHLNYVARVVRAARTFVARMLAALRAAQGNDVIITAHVKADIGWFLRYLHAHNVKSIIPHGRTVLRIWADSSLTGGGATDGARYYAYKYPPAISDHHHITQLEALNTLAAVRTFVDPTHAGGVVEVYCDNSASVSAYTSGRARDGVLAACCRAMWFVAAATNTSLEFAHVPGESMILPDALSRAHADPRLNAKAQEIISKRPLQRQPIDKRAFCYSSFM